MEDNSISESPGKEEIVTWAEMRGMISKISWAWPGWLPHGFLVIIAGESGTGKSAVVLRLCGCFTNGMPWPDGTPFCDEPGSVLWCEGEAAQAINLERAQKYGLNMSRFITPFSDPLLDVHLDSDAHRDRIREVAMWPDVKLIVIDSLRGVNNQDENSSDINGMIKFLAEIARDTGKIIILTHHLRKRSIVDSEDIQLDRLRGSSAIVQTARVVWAINMPNDPEQPKTLKVIKSNLGMFPDPIGFHISDTEIEFCEAPTQPQKSSVLQEAIDLLKMLLSRGAVPVDEIRQDFSDSGISWRTANTAKKKLGIVSRKIGGKGGHIEWGLPAKDLPPEEIAPD